MHLIVRRGAQYKQVQSPCSITRSWDSRVVVLNAVPATLCVTATTLHPQPPRLYICIYRNLALQAKSTSPTHLNSRYCLDALHRTTMNPRASTICGVFNAFCAVTSAYCEHLGMISQLVPELTRGPLGRPDLSRVQLPHISQLTTCMLMVSQDSLANATCVHWHAYTWSDIQGLSPKSDSSEEFLWMHIIWKRSPEIMAHTTQSPGLYHKSISHG